MRTWRQLNVIAAVTVHKQAGQRNHKIIYIRTHICKQTSPSLHSAINKDTNNLCVYVLSCSNTSPGNWGGVSVVQACPCLCKSDLSETLLIWWLMTVDCYTSPSFSLSLHLSFLLNLQPTANIYLEVYPGSMQSWMSATQEFFCSESMVSRMYSPPFSTCESSKTQRLLTAL